MVRRLPVAIRVPLAAVLVALNTVTHAAPLLALAVLKFLLPLTAIRRRLSAALVGLAESWVGVNSALIGLFTPIRWQISGTEGLKRDGWYLVLSNHQSWVDIPVLQHVLHRRAPFPKFFLKRALIWVPVLGLAWWALDFPFMRRSSREDLERHPELRGRDRDATRRACAKFRELPVSVTNFVEGTRRTPAKHARQESPYHHLLRPRAGGVAFVLDAMGDTLRSVLDVSIVYPGPPPTLLDLMAGRFDRIRVDVREFAIPDDLLGGDYEADPAYRERFQRWINALWADKDARISAMRDEIAAVTSPAAVPSIA
jgi:1-acyl-sn-glycerol-3-phosphate acyltransferase